MNREIGIKRGNRSLSLIHSEGEEKEGEGRRRKEKEGEGRRRKEKEGDDRRRKET